MRSRPSLPTATTALWSLSSDCFPNKLVLPHKGQDFRLIKERNFIGQAEDNQICLNADAEVSRQRHCSVIYDPRSSKFVALAGESTSTTLNGEQLSTAAFLQDGDVLGLGATSLCFISFCKEGRNWE